MAKHKHVINLSEVRLDKVNAPGSAFGGMRRRVGAHIGAQKLGTVFLRAAGQGPFSFSHA